MRAAPGWLEATLLLEGTTCAACIWLNEQHVTRLPGVQAIEINYTTHRARVRWDPARIRLSEILRAVQAIGYRAFPADSAAAEQGRRRENRAALWRLFVAGFGMMQVMMYAVPTYLADDGSMSADIVQLMRIASFVLTVPVVFYACGPFFRGAWQGIAQGSRVAPRRDRARGAWAEVSELSNRWARVSGSFTVRPDLLRRDEPTRLIRLHFLVAARN